jgi:aspartate aminotransferase
MTKPTLASQGADGIATADPVTAPQASRASALGESLIGSEILKIAAEIRAMRAEGVQICNLTVGDFDPAEFRIPQPLAKKIEEALQRGETNYPPAEGIQPLRQAVSAFYERWLRLKYAPTRVLITGGSRPGIYGTFRTIVDPGDRVVYPVPSWNNNHYVHLTGAVGVPVPCGADEAFLPTPELLESALYGARLLCLNSPLNPAGTAFDADTLAAICDLILRENRRRSPAERPLYVMYDQVYWMLTLGRTKHVDPVSLRPEMEPYTIIVDGVSKAFAATGLRVGWVVGPDDIVQRMSNLLGHVGAWAPRAEQVATAQFLAMNDEVAAFRTEITRGLETRLNALHDAIAEMRADGYPVDAIEPMGTIYLSARFALNGCHTRSGTTLRTNEEIRRYLLQEAGLAGVPFQAFGGTEESGWFRLSVGAVSVAEIERVMPRVRAALEGIE